MTLRGPGGGDPGYDGNFSMNFEPSFGFELDCPTRISATTFKSRYNYSLTSHTPPLPFAFKVTGDSSPTHGHFP